MNKTHTKGNIIVEDIEIGDIHYEFELNCCVKSVVITKPSRDDDGVWSWKSKGVKHGKIINYSVNEKYQHYGPNLYDYEAYYGCKHI